MYILCCIVKINMTDDRLFSDGYNAFRKQDYQKALNLFTNFLDVPNKNCSLETSAWHYMSTCDMQLKGTRYIEYSWKSILTDHKNKGLSKQHLFSNLAAFYKLIKERLLSSVCISIIRKNLQVEQQDTHSNEPMDPSTLITMYLSDESAWQHQACVLLLDYSPIAQYTIRNYEQSRLQIVRDQLIQVLPNHLIVQCIGPFIILPTDDSTNVYAQLYS